MKTRKLGLDGPDVSAIGLGCMSFAGFFGVAVSLAISYGLAWWFFENLWKWTWQISLASVIGVTSLSVGVAWLATQRTLRSSPLSLLRCA